MSYGNENVTIRAPYMPFDFSSIHGDNQKAQMGWEDKKGLVNNQNSTTPSMSDLSLAGVGVLGHMYEMASGNILSSRAGYSSGKMFEGSPFIFSSKKQNE